jgi:hypothetical protein
MKETIALTDDNWHDYFGMTILEQLVKGLVIPDDGIDRQSGVVGLLLEWVAEQSRRSKTKQYTMTRHDAAVVLELAAGWHGGPMCRRGPRRAVLVDVLAGDGRPFRGRCDRAADEGVPLRVADPQVPSAEHREHLDVIAGERAGPPAVRLSAQSIAHRCNDSRPVVTAGRSVPGHDHAPRQDGARRRHAGHGRVGVRRRAARPRHRRRAGHQQASRVRPPEERRPRPRRRTDAAERRRQWAREWNAAADPDGVATVRGLSRYQAHLRRNALQAKVTVRLKKLTRVTTGAAIAALLRQGKTPKAARALGIAHRGHVNRIAKQLREQRAK